VGQGASHRSSGEKRHLVTFSRIVGKLGEHKPGTYRVGAFFSQTSRCNANGQHTTHVVAGLDTKDITCEKCLKRLGQWEGK
jgi:hypothetical protein